MDFLNCISFIIKLTKLTMHILITIVSVYTTIVNINNIITSNEP